MSERKSKEAHALGSGSREAFAPPGETLTRSATPESESHALAMPAAPRLSWWSAVAAVFATYVYFLIFAEFAFLELVRAITPEPGRLQWVMFGLGAGGVAGAILGARWYRAEWAWLLLGWAFRACAFSAVFALLVKSFWSLLAAAALVGISLGWLTVTLTAALRRAAGAAWLGRCIGLGTGLAYGCCNLPWLFEASPTAQAVIAGGLVLAASFVPGGMAMGQATVAIATADDRPGGVARWVVVLLALVWMDSAAFYIVQHTPALRAATWDGGGALYTNAAVHLLGAVGAGWLLDLGWRGAIAGSATVLLAGACLMLNGALPPLAPPAWLYTAGVSLYSTVLVEYPARCGRAGVAALVFAVAGWVGSALGIGMAQDLRSIPLAFVFGAGAAVALALGWRWRRLRHVALAGALLAAGTARSDAAESDPWVVLGREVYIAEGCIHCHSQYVRPRVALDVERWGPATSLTEALAASPPLLGNRRQGPDLANVGNRRSLEWNRLHLTSPRLVAPGSRMPSYAHLFAGAAERGEALLAYLASLGAGTIAARQAAIAAWQPAAEAPLPADDSRRLFQRLCAPCHGENGRGDGPLAARLSVRPADWSQSEWRHVPAGAKAGPVLSRIIKFGLPGLPMAGHEYLPDRDVVGLARHVQALHSARPPASIAAAQP